MSRIQYESLPKLTCGDYDSRIMVRIIRMWRGCTRTGEEFKNFNLLLIDNKRNRVHAFVPAGCAEELSSQISVGKVYCIKNFSVQMYKNTEKFRCLRNDTQLVFSKDTKITELQDDGVSILDDNFDFYDHSELENLSKQTTYLTDLVGIIKNNKKFRDLKNKHGQAQRQAKFIITDGGSNVNVTFWDSFGAKFEKDRMQNLEQPIIIILSYCRVGKWNGEIDISNVPATKYYLNHNHHSVQHLRKLLTKPDFAKKAFAQPQSKKTELLNVDQIKNLGKNHIESCVVSHVRITAVENMSNWFYNACTNCGRETKILNSMNVCEGCQRIIPYPNKMFRIEVVVADASGEIKVVLGDREIRTLIGKRARQLLDEGEKETVMPHCLLNLAQKDYTMVMKIKEMNIVKRFHVYFVNNICYGFVKIVEDESGTTETRQQAETQATTSSYPTQGISDVNFSSNPEA